MPRPRRWSAISSQGRRAAAKLRGSGELVPPRGRGRPQSAARALGRFILRARRRADPDEAAHWLRVSRRWRSGLPSRLANLVLKGAGNAEDPASVAQWFEQAAAGRPHRRLQFRPLPGGGCRRRSRRGAGRPMDAPGRRGVPEAQYMYGRMLAEAAAWPPIEGSAHWLARAAEPGSRSAGRARGDDGQRARRPRDVGGALGCSPRPPPRAMSAPCSRWRPPRRRPRVRRSRRAALVPRGGRGGPRPCADDAGPVSRRRRPASGTSMRPATGSLAPSPRESSKRRKIWQPCPRGPTATTNPIRTCRPLASDRRAGPGPSVLHFDQFA